jgi:hypothetical protein
MEVLVRVYVILLSQEYQSASQKGMAHSLFIKIKRGLLM